MHRTASRIASIDLTILVVVAVCLLLDTPLVLGLEAQDTALLTLVFLVDTIAIGAAAGPTQSWGSPSR